MAINYSSVFQNLGKIIGRNNSYGSLASTTLPADLQAIIAQFGTGSTTYGDAQGPIQGLTATYQSMQSDIAKWRRSLQPYTDKTLTDVDTVVSQLAGLSSTDVRTVVPAILQNMSDVGQTVKGNTVSLGSPTAGTGNIGNGTVLVDATLDGYNAPLTGAAASVLYNALLSQLAVPSETMLITCTTDSFSGGTEGAEQWSWTGGQKWPLFDWHQEGSGPGPGLQTANAATLLQNLSFESFSVANTPDSWTIVVGAAGTDIYQETTAANVFRGSSAIRFTGTGAIQPSIKQAFTVSQLFGRRRYLCTIQAFKGGAAPGAGNLTIKLTGTGYSAAGSEQININLTTLGANYGRYSFYVNLPAAVPSDLALSIAITGANLANGANIYLDSMTFSPVVYHGGINAQVIAGSTPWTKGDRLSWAVSSNAIAIFQEYFRKCYATQLPSKTDGTQTINDAWAA